MESSFQPTVPSVTLPWEAVPTYSGNWTPHFVGAEAELSQTYRAGQQQVHVYLAFYVNQQQGKELINPRNTLVDGERWVLLAEGSREVVVDGQPLHVQERTIRSAYGTRLVWSWYWVGGRFISNPYLAKLLQAKAQLLNELRDSAIFAVGTDIEFAKADATTTLEDFLHHTSILAAHPKGKS